MLQDREVTTAWTEEMIKEAELVLESGDRLNVRVGRWRKLVTPRFLAWGTDWI